MHWATRVNVGEPMARVSQGDRKRMENAYRSDVARFLVRSASKGNLVTYGELTAEFGGVDRGWGNTLGGIALRCNKAKLPLLSVIVVSKATNRPSVDAVLYEDLGLADIHDIESEQARCFAFDWSATTLA